MNIRPLRAEDLPAAREIFQLAFGTVRNVPDPARFMEDRDYINTRWHAHPAAAFAAEIDGVLAGTAFGANWGTFGVFGPLTIHPRFWNRSVGKALMEPCIARQVALGARYIGLFTFADSPKHVRLYQRFDFWPRFLGALMSKPPGVAPQPDFARFGALDSSSRPSALTACRELSGSVLEGLDLAHEINAVAAQQLGETLLLHGPGGVDAFAVCHCGKGTEAGTGACYVKFGLAVNSDAFRRLLRAVESFASERGMPKVVAGVSTARREAYQLMFDAGFKTDMQGIAMHRPDHPFHSRPGVLALDDWR